MRVLLATNERSGTGAAVQAERLLGELGAEVAEPGEAVERVVVAGGDGSVGPGAAAAVEAGVPLAVVPVGTANDFARAAGLPFGLEEACRLALAPGAATAPFELARMDGRPFLNVASTGLSVVAAREARPLKPRLGVLAYAVGALRAALTHRAQDVVVEVDGSVAFRGAAWQVVVAATGRFGGGAGVGGTRPDDRALDVVVVPDGSRLALVRRAVGMRRHRLHAQDDVPHLRGRDVRVSGPRSWNVDGEVCACDGVARFEVEHRMVDVVVGP